MFRTTSLVRARIGPSASQLCDLQQLLRKVQQLELEKAELQSQISCGSSGVAMTKGKPDLAAAAQTVATPTRSKEPESTPTRSKEPESTPTRSKEPATTATRSKEPAITPTRFKEPVFHSPTPGANLAAVLNGVEIKTQAHPVPKPPPDSVGLDGDDGDESSRVNSQTHRKEYMKLAAWISLCGYVHACRPCDCTGFLCYVHLQSENRRYESGALAEYPNMLALQEGTLNAA